MQRFGLLLKRLRRLKAWALRSMLLTSSERTTPLWTLLNRVSLITLFIQAKATKNQLPITSNFTTEQISLALLQSLHSILPMPLRISLHHVTRKRTPSLLISTLCVKKKEYLNFPKCKAPATTTFSLTINAVLSPVLKVLQLNFATGTRVSAATE